MATKVAITIIENTNLRHKIVLNLPFLNAVKVLGCAPKIPGAFG